MHTTAQVRQRQHLSANCPNEPYFSPFHVCGQTGHLTMHAFACPDCGLERCEEISRQEEQRQIWYSDAYTLSARPPPPLQIWYIMGSGGGGGFPTPALPLTVDVTNFPGGGASVHRRRRCHNFYPSSSHPHFHFLPSTYRQSCTVGGTKKE